MIIIKHDISFLCYMLCSNWAGHTCIVHVFQIDKESLCIATVRCYLQVNWYTPRMMDIFHFIIQLFL